MSSSIRRLVAVVVMSLTAVAGVSGGAAMYGATGRQPHAAVQAGDEWCC
jgi:hypothetical protein